MYLFEKVMCFMVTEHCDCEDNTHSNCYVLKYSEIVLPNTCNPLKHYKLHHYWYIYPI